MCPSTVHHNITVLSLTSGGHVEKTHCHPGQPGRAEHRVSEQRRQWRRCPHLHLEAAGNQPGHKQSPKADVATLK